jgi:hypothetical protein
MDAATVLAAEWNSFARDIRNIDAGWYRNRV